MMQHDVIIACDFKSAEDTFKFLDLFRDEERKPFLKIGMELFYAEGPAIVREIKRRGHRIFLDLKLHDIPNTVKKAMAVLSRLDVDMCNVHAAGTVEMMKYALEGLTREDGTRPLLIAVTQLTSTSEERMREELLIDASINDTIVKYAQNTRAAGLDGVVCSPLEAGMVITDEPGIYIEGSHGIRTENELVVRKGEETEYGQFMYFEPITYVPIDLDAINPDLLREDEKAWLNAYHKQVYDIIAPHLTKEEEEWLRIYTREI